MTSIYNAIWVFIKSLMLNYLKLLYIVNDLTLEVDASILLYFFIETRTVEGNWREVRLLVSIID